MIQDLTSNLSGAWRMRLALANALYVPASGLILFDESCKSFGFTWTPLVNSINKTNNTLLVVFTMSPSTMSRQANFLFLSNFGLWRLKSPSTSHSFLPNFSRTQLGCPGGLIALGWDLSQDLLYHHYSQSASWSLLECVSSSCTHCRWWGFQTTKRSPLDSLALFLLLFSTKSSEFWVSHLDSDLVCLLRLTIESLVLTMIIVSMSSLLKIRFRASLLPGLGSPLSFSFGDPTLASAMIMESAIWFWASHLCSDLVYLIRLTIESSTLTAIMASMFLLPTIGFRACLLDASALFSLLWLRIPSALTMIWNQQFNFEQAIIWPWLLSLSFSWWSLWRRWQ